MVRYLLALCLLAGGATVTQAQQAVPTPVGGSNPNSGAAAAASPAPADSAPAAPGRDESETALSQLIGEVVRNQQTMPDAVATTTYTPEQQIAYNQWVLSYTQGAYAWHHASTVIIFFVVIFVVLSGVVLAGWQLRAWLGRVAAYDRVFLSRLEQGQEVRPELLAETGKAGVHELSLQSKAVALTTPYVGVIILGLSMGFFLAYLLLVYPILQGP